MVTYDFTLHLRVCDHITRFWRFLGMAFGHFLLGSHNFLVMALGSCVKWPLYKFTSHIHDRKRPMNPGMLPIKNHRTTLPYGCKGQIAWTLLAHSPIGKEEEKRKRKRKVMSPKNGWHHPFLHNALSTNGFWLAIIQKLQPKPLVDNRNDLLMHFLAMSHTSQVIMDGCNGQIFLLSSHKVGSYCRGHASKVTHSWVLRLWNGYQGGHPVHFLDGYKVDGPDLDADLFKLGPYQYYLRWNRMNTNYSM